MYTVAEEHKLVELYADEMPIQDIATALDKSERSVIGKLVFLKKYKPKATTSKVTGGAPKTKGAYVKDIEAILEVQLHDLDKAPKTTLINLKEALEQWLGS